MTITTGKYYTFRDTLFKAERCEFCPTNIHKVRQRCDEQNGKEMCRLIYMGMIKSSPSSKEYQKAPSTYLFECYFQEGMYKWDPSGDRVREATDAEIAKVVLEKV